MRRIASVFAFVLVAGACYERAGTSSGSANTGPSTAAPSSPSPSAPPTLEAPAGLTPLADAAKKAPGTRVKTRAFLWLFRPHCPPCPPGADCEQCPPPYFQFSERPHRGIGSHPGAIVLVELIALEPKLDVESEYLLEGELKSVPTAGGHPVLSVDKIAVLRAARPK